MALEIGATQDERRTNITALLQQAEEAHFQYQSVILRHPDPDRPRWLAGFVLDRSFGKLLAAPVSEDQLGELLHRYDGEYDSGGDHQQSRAEFYAERLLAEVR